MSALPERTVEAAMDRYWETGWAGKSPREIIKESIERTMDPALGLERLVVAGPFEQEIVEKVCAWIHDNEAWLEGRYITDAIREHFIPSPESNT